MPPPPASYRSCAIAPEPSRLPKGEPMTDATTIRAAIDKAAREAGRFILGRSRGIRGRDHRLRVHSRHLGRRGLPEADALPRDPGTQPFHRFRTNPASINPFPPGPPSRSLRGSAFVVQRARQDASVGVAGARVAPTAARPTKGSNPRNGRIRQPG